MGGTGDRRWIRNPFWPGSLWLAHPFLIIPLTVGAPGLEELGKKAGFSQTSKAEMSLSHNPAHLFFGLSEWKRKAAVVRRRQSMNSTNLILFALIRLSHSYIFFFFEAASAPRRGFCSDVFFKLINLKPVFSLGGVCITEAVLLLHTNDGGTR